MPKSFSLELPFMYFHQMELENFGLKKMKEVKMETVVEDQAEHEKAKLVGAATVRVSGGGRKGAVGGGGGGGKSCQAEKCTADLTEAKQYHRRHKVCEHHAKAQAVLVDGIPQRFCQQCSRFHELSEFDETKRSCRRRLAGHNLRRRKSTSDLAQTTESSSSSPKATDVQLKKKWLMVREDLRCQFNKKSASNNSTLDN